MTSPVSSSVATNIAINATKPVLKHFRITYTRCAQCGKELRTLPFNIVNIILCKDCYGIDRYKRTGAPIWGHGDGEPAGECVA